MYLLASALSICTLPDLVNQASSVPGEIKSCLVQVIRGHSSACKTLSNISVYRRAAEGSPLFPIHTSVTRRCWPHRICSLLLISAHLIYARLWACCLTHPVNDLSLSICWWRMVKGCIRWWWVFLVAPLAMSRGWMKGTRVLSVRPKLAAFPPYLLVFHWSLHIGSFGFLASGVAASIPDNDNYPSQNGSEVIFLSYQQYHISV